MFVFANLLDAVAQLLSAVLDFYFWVVIIAAVMSWVGNRTLAHDVFERLCAPLLAPIRRRIPLVGGVDLSPLLLVVVLQVLGMVLSSLQSGVLGSGALAMVG